MSLLDLPGWLLGVQNLQTHTLTSPPWGSSLWGMSTISKVLAAQVGGSDCVGGSEFDAQHSCKAQNTVVCAGLSSQSGYPGKPQVPVRDSQNHTH